MTVKPVLYELARQELVTRFATRPLDLERVFLEALRAATNEIGEDWNVVVDADAADCGSEDWRNLNQLIACHVIPKVEQAVSIHEPEPNKTVLTYHLNWFTSLPAKVVMLSPRWRRRCKKAAFTGLGS